MITAKKAKKISDEAFDKLARDKYYESILKIDACIAQSINEGYGAVYIEKTQLKDEENELSFLRYYYKRLGYRFWPGPQNLLFAVHWDDKKPMNKAFVS